MKDIDITKERYKIAKKQFKTIKQECESKVESWFWASFALYSIEPYHFEKNHKHFPKGKILKKEPANKKNKWLYGVDKNGEIVVERQYTSLDFENSFYETFYCRNTDFIEVFQFDYDNRHLVDLKQYWLDNGQVVKEQTYDDEKVWCVEIYVYNEEKPVKSFRKHMFSPPNGLIESTFEYEYEESEILNRIYWDGKICYEKK